MKTFYRICIVTGLLLLTACGSQKRMGSSNKARPDAERATLEHVLQAQPQFSSAQASKIRVSINYAGRKVNAGGTISVLTDSAIVLSVQPLLGIELFRVELTPQTITVVDKMNRRYAQADYTALQQALGVPVTYSNIEALCMAHLFIIGKSEEAIKQLRPTLTEDADNLLLHFTEDRLQYTFVTDKQNALITETRLHPTGNEATSSVRYLNYEITDGVVFPRTIEISYQSDRLSGTCTISILRLQFNTGTSTTPLNLERYTPVSLKTLLP